MKKIISLLLLAFFACSFANKNSFSFFKKEKKDTTIIALVGNIAIQFTGPSNLSITAPNPPPYPITGIANLTWINNANYDSIQIYRSANDTIFELISTTKNTGIYHDTSYWSHCADSSYGFVVNINQYYKIIGLKNGFSHQSNIANIRANQVAVPRTPSSLAATAKSSTTDTVTWMDLPSFVAHFALYRSINDNHHYAYYTDVPCPPDASFGFRDSLLIPNTIYYYKVTAVNLLCQETPYSNEDSCKTFP